MNKLSHRTSPAVLSIRPIDDYDEIQSIYNKPENQGIGCDHRPPAPVIHPDVYYFGAYANEELMGVFILIESGFIDFEVHHLLTKKAVPYSRKFGSMFIDLVFKQTNAQRLSAIIPAHLKGAVNYCRKMGFNQEGFKPDAIQVNGSLFGVELLGMTRKDYETTK